MLSGTVLLLLFLVLMFMGIPVAHSMIITAYITIKFIHPEIPTIIVAQRLFGGADNYILLCIPFFVLAGDLMSMTTLFDRLIKVANAMVGHIRGALSHITIVVAMFFAGITGAAVADTSAVGTVLIPAMIKQGYSRAYATALTVVASTIGVIIPPSNLMVVAALVSSSSVAALLLGGVIPGVLAALSLLVVSVYYGVKYNFPKEPKLTWAGRAKALWYGIPALGIPVVLMGGILTGIVTPTEAANISIIYALIVGPIMMRGFPAAEGDLQELGRGVHTHLDGDVRRGRLGDLRLDPGHRPGAGGHRRVHHHLHLQQDPHHRRDALHLPRHRDVPGCYSHHPDLHADLPSLGRETGHPGGGLHGHDGLRVGYGVGQSPLRLLSVGRRGHRRYSGGEIHLGTDSVPECDDCDPGR